MSILVDSCRFFESVQDSQEQLSRFKDRSHYVTRGQKSLFFYISEHLQSRKRFCIITKTEKNNILKQEISQKLQFQLAVCHTFPINHVSNSAPRNKTTKVYHTEKHKAQKTIW